MEGNPGREIIATMRPIDRQRERSVRPEGGTRIRDENEREARR